MVDPTLVPAPRAEVLAAITFALQTSDGGRHLHRLARETLATRVLDQLERSGFVQMRKADAPVT